MVKVRVSEIAKEVALKSKDVIEKAAELGLSLKSASSAIDSEEAMSLMNYILTGEKPEASAQVYSDEKPTEDGEVLTKAKDLKLQQQNKEISSALPEQTDVKISKQTLGQTQEEGVKEKEEVAVDEQTLSGVSLTKRRGLFFVKKKSDTQKEESLSEQKPKESKKEDTLEDMFKKESFDRLAEIEAKKKKKLKKIPAPKKEKAEKIDFDFISDRTAEIDAEDEMLVLPDFKVVDLPEKKKDKKDFDVSKVKTTKVNTFLDQGLQRRSGKKRKRQQVETAVKEVKAIEISEQIRVYEFAEKMGKQSSDIIKTLFMLGMIVTKNDFLDKDAIEILAHEFGIEITTVNNLEEFDYLKDYEENKKEATEEKPPVITIMGHVDHGKTSLLDYIRKSRVAQREAGGITQHVGAYMVNKNGKKITFVDTPGHEAFTEMRARGAKITDIAIIVVAADDGVMPQTKEAIDHAKAANVPIIIAINKMDKPAANPDHVKTQLADLGIMPTEWGGSHEFAHVSAHTGEGIEDLLELILLQAEVMELKANFDEAAKAIVVESSLEKGKGPVATVIVQNGTLKMGDTIVCGMTFGRARALLDENGKQIKEARPGEPCIVLGLSDVPPAGEALIATPSEKEAREYAQKRIEFEKQKEFSRSTKVTFDELSQKIAQGQIKTLPVIVRADVQGSLEAIKGSLEKIGTDEVKVNIISSGVGAVTESDVSLASTSSECVIFGFNTKPTSDAKLKAKSAGVEIKQYSIIYDLLDDVKGLLSGLLSPIIKEEEIGSASVREVFVIPKIGAIAGCIVRDGVIKRNAKARLVRDGVVMCVSKVESLKRFKDDAREVTKGFECGIGLDNFNDMKPGDVIEVYIEKEEKASL